jgi:hypothetical protein
MGHDIFARAGKPEEGKEEEFLGLEEDAYLRRGAGNNLAREIYRVLGAEEYDAGCSGSGEVAYFTHDQIKAALARLGDGEDLEPERTFLNSCLAYGEAGVTISFL